MAPLFRKRYGIQAGWAKLDWKSRLHYFRSGKYQSLCGRVDFENQYCNAFYPLGINPTKRNCCTQCRRLLEAA